MTQSHSQPPLEVTSKTYPYRIWAHDNLQYFTDQYPTTPFAKIEAKMKYYWRYNITQAQKDGYEEKKRQILRDQALRCERKRKVLEDQEVMQMRSAEKMRYNGKNRILITPYTLYCENRLPELRRNASNITMADAFRDLTSDWDNLSFEEKQVYMDLYKGTVPRGQQSRSTGTPTTINTVQVQQVIIPRCGHYSTPQPSYSISGTAYNTPEAHGTPQHIYSTSEADSTPEVAYSTPETTYSAPGTIYSTREITHSTPEPTYSTLPQGYSTLVEASRQEDLLQSSNQQNLPTLDYGAYSNPLQCLPESNYSNQFYSTQSFNFQENQVPTQYHYSKNNEYEPPRKCRKLDSNFAYSNQVSQNLNFQQPISQDSQVKDLVGNSNLNLNLENYCFQKENEDILEALEALGELGEEDYCTQLN